MITSQMEGRFIPSFCFFKVRFNLTDYHISEVTSMEDITLKSKEELTFKDKLHINFYDLVSVLATALVTIMIIFTFVFIIPVWLLLSVHPV